MVKIAKQHKVKMTPAMEKKAMAEFHKADKNGDKHVDIKELKAAMGKWETNSYILSFVRLHNAWS